MANGTPRREWLGVVLPPACAAGLLAVAATDAGTAQHGWLVFALATLAGLVPPLIYTLVMAREGRLFLRHPEDIERSRTRIRTVSIPLGWVLAGALGLSSAIVGQLSTMIVYCVLGGALIGFWPGLAANFIRLRREVWRSPGVPHDPS